MLSSVERRIRRSDAYAIARHAWRSLRRGLGEARRIERRRVTLEPEGTPRGNVLVAYIVGGLLPDAPISHTHYWESAQIARTWRDMGYRVDVIDNYNHDFEPRRKYDFLIAARMIMERLAERVDDSCVKVVHLDTAHWLFHATEEHRRMLHLQERRGVTLSRLYPVERNFAIERADCATMLGNSFTESTYAYAGKPIYRIPISTIETFPWPEEKDFEAVRRHFIWFGSRAPVHKGLDVVLEAFAGLPEYRLTVIGPVADDEQFAAAYHEELYVTPNVTAVGWVDLPGGEFERLARRAVALVYPSCSEGQAGCVVACMHAGLIPVVSRTSGVDVAREYGRLLDDCTVEEIRRSVRRLAESSPAELRRMARNAWEYARANHTREAFADRYREAAVEIERTFGSGAARGAAKARPERRAG